VGLFAFMANRTPPTNEPPAVVEPLSSEDAGLAAVDPSVDAGLADAGNGSSDGGPSDGGPSDASTADASVVQTGLRVLDRPIGGSWSSREAVAEVLARVEPIALDCYRRTQPPGTTRKMKLVFIVRTAGVSVTVDPGDTDGKAYRRCLSFRLPPSLPWPERRDTSTAGLVIGDESPL